MSDPAARRSIPYSRKPLNTLETYGIVIEGSISTSKGWETTVKDRAFMVLPYEFETGTNLRE